MAGDIYRTVEQYQIREELSQATDNAGHPKFALDKRVMERVILVLLLVFGSLLIMILLVLGGVFFIHLITGNPHTLSINAALFRTP